MTGPPLHTIAPIAKRLSAAAVKIGKVTPPADLANGHALVRSAWELAENALRLRAESVSSNNIDIAQRASSAAAGALMLYQRARADLAAAMAPPHAQVITPRRTRLLRAADLAGFRAHLVEIARARGRRRRQLRAGADAGGRRAAAPHAARAARRRPRPCRSSARAPICTTLLLARLRPDARTLVGLRARGADRRRRPRRRRRRHAAAVPRAAGPRRRDAGALRLPAPPASHGRRLRSPADRRTRAGRRFGSGRGAAARANALPGGHVSRLRGAAARQRRARRARRAPAADRDAGRRAVAAHRDHRRRPAAGSRRPVAGRRRAADEHRRPRGHRRDRHRRRARGRLPRSPAPGVCRHRGNRVAAAGARPGHRRARRAAPASCRSCSSIAIARRSSKAWRGG